LILIVSRIPKVGHQANLLVFFAKYPLKLSVREPTLTLSSLQTKKTKRLPYRQRLI
jgi:hypothetical protein